MVQGQPREKLIRYHLNKKARYGDVLLSSLATQGSINRRVRVRLMQA
jgi:hypothetical protein